MCNDREVLQLPENSNFPFFTPALPPGHIKSKPEIRKFPSIFPENERKSGKMIWKFDMNEYRVFRQSKHLIMLVELLE